MGKTKRGAASGRVDVKKTAEGKLFFFNRSLNKTQWKAPTL